MSFSITDACNGCGACKRICPADAIGGEKKKLHVIDDTLCIVEAMKLMNEIKCEVRGIIVDILVTKGQAVEFDQPLFKIKKT